MKDILCPLCEKLYSDCECIGLTLDEERQRNKDKKIKELEIKLRNATSSICKYCKAYDCYIDCIGCE